MTHSQKLGSLVCSAVFLLGSVLSWAQGDPATLIKEKLVSQVKLTKASAAFDDIVTAGDVVVLHKDNLVMCNSDNSYRQTNVYLNGNFTVSTKGRAGDFAKKALFGKLTGSGTVAGAAQNGCTTRKFVAGEKFWVTDIQISKDGKGIVVTAFSDPFNDKRYLTDILFPFPGGTPPAVDTEVKTVQEVFTVQPAEEDKSEKAEKKDEAPAEAAPAAAPAASSAALAPIPPPPPPADAPPAPPKTISKGQTRDIVVATWGQPTKDIKLGTKEILVYPDMKVTFIAGKVSDVE
jgi:hypothetical protein